MLELINRVCDLAAEVTKAQIIIDGKDRQIEEMQKYIDDQRGLTDKMQEDNRKMREQLEGHRMRELAPGPSRPDPGANDLG